MGTEFSSFFEMIQDAARYSVESNDPIRFVPDITVRPELAWTARIGIVSEAGRVWSITVASYHASLQELPSDVTTLVREMMTSPKGQAALISSALSHAARVLEIERLRPSVWELVVRDEPLD